MTNLTDKLALMYEQLAKEAILWDIKVKKAGACTLNYVKYDNKECGWTLEQNGKLLFVLGEQTPSSLARMCKHNFERMFPAVTVMSMEAFKTMLTYFFDAIRSWNADFYTFACMVGTFKGESDDMP